MRFLSLFSGIGGFDLGLERAGMTCVGQVEYNPFCQKVLKKHWPNVKLMGDIKKTSFWNLAHNDGKDYIINICVQKNSSDKVLKVLRLHIQQNSQEELNALAKIVDYQGFWHQVLQLEDGDFALKNADMILCEDRPGQTLVEGNGCEAQEILTGREGKQPTGDKDTKKLSSRNGAEGFLQGTHTPVKIVDISLEQKTLLMHITLNLGLNIQTSDLISQTELLYAESVIRKSTTRIDIVCGGPPCQPASKAGKRRGTEDDRWLWGETLRIVSETKPKWCVFENPTGILSLQGGVPFDKVCSDLEDKGYEVWPVIIPACAVNAPHRRDRVWIIAYSKSSDDRRKLRNLSSQNEAQPIPKEQHEDQAGESCNANRDDSNAFNTRLQGGKQLGPLDQGARTPQPASEFCEDATDSECVTNDNGGNGASSICREQSKQAELCRSQWKEPWLEIASRLCRVDDGLPNRVDRLKSLGNAVVPQIVEIIGKAIYKQTKLFSGVA